MASNREWALYRALRASVADAVYTALEDLDEGVKARDCIILISPDLDEVFAYWNTDISEIDMQAFPDWHVEHMTNEDDIEDIVMQYFDLR